MSTLLPKPARLLRATLLVVATLACGPAVALTETYGGYLVPNGTEGTIPIVVELREIGSVLTGKVRTGYPISGNAAIAAGDYRSGQCRLKVVLSAAVTLWMQGICRSTLFEGKYTIHYTLRDDDSEGRFRLSRKSPEEAKKPFAAAPSSSTASIAACQRANLHCLTACPRGDPDAEFLCANRCRSKLQACKGKAAGGTAAAP
jgi:hypothetical protein